MKPLLTKKPLPVCRNFARTNADLPEQANKPDTIEALEIIIGAAQRKYITMKEGTALYGLGRHTFEKLAKDSGARRRISGRVLVNTQKLDEYIEDMFSE